jgi:thymidylate kinase
MFVLDVPPEIAAERRMRRGEATQLYEQNEMQRALAVFYRDLVRHMPDERIVMIEGTGSPDEVHERIWSAYRRECGEPGR